MSTFAFFAAYDGLTAFRRSGGAAGLTLVPDLAKTLPRPADGGTTYTFTLRRGIRYSNGNLVRASDFRRGIQRELIIGPAAGIPDYWDGILGAQACQQHPKQCDLSAGIVTDDAAGRVTFRLAQADPDFLYKLALINVSPAPPGTPDRAISRAPFLPGTGPYMISQVRPGKSVTLVRNPHFRQWSYAAQPAGYPSVIRHEQVERPKHAGIGGYRRPGRPGVPGIQRPSVSGHPVSGPRPFRRQERALNLPPSTPASRRSRTSRPGRPSTTPSIAPGSCSSSDFASGQATVTCQMLPPDFPGHQAYCPYTTGAGDGAWHGPDMEKARRLVQGIRHEEHAGDRLEPGRSPRQGGRLLPC